MICLNHDTFVVFDLDDTLYSEDHYQHSGLMAVADFVWAVYRRELRLQLLQWKAEGETDLWYRLCQELGIPASAKESFLWIYRLHAPRIKLPPAARDTVSCIAMASAGVAILTDGRSCTQRLKAAALGLAQYPLYVSEEWLSEKPDPRRFMEITRKHPAKQYVYVGDNPQKDFKAPNELGWMTIGIRDSGHNVHPQSCEHLDASYHPRLWIGEIQNLCELLC